jgi:hypothetical protein
MHAIAFPKPHYSLDTYEGGEVIEHETYRVDQEYYEQPTVTMREGRSIKDAIPSLPKALHPWRRSINAEAKGRMRVDMAASG